MYVFIQAYVGIYLGEACMYAYACSCVHAFVCMHVVVCMHMCKYILLQFRR